MFETIDLVVPQEDRDNVLPEFPGRLSRILPERIEEKRRPEEIDGERRPVIEGISRLFDIIRHPPAPFVLFVDRSKTKPGSTFFRDLCEGDGQIGLLFNMELDKFPVVHLVDMIAGENHHHIRFVHGDEIDILIDSVCRSLVPVGRPPALKGRQNGGKPVSAYHIPGLSVCDVVDEAERPVLREYADFLDSRRHKAGHRKIDDTVDPAKGQDRLGAKKREHIEFIDPPPCKNHSQNICHRFVSPYRLIRQQAR